MNMKNNAIEVVGNYDTLFLLCVLIQQHMTMLENTIGTYISVDKLNDSAKRFW